MQLTINETKQFKRVSSPEYNFVFRKDTGVFIRWGKTPEDDPVMAPSPEILDLEISSGGDCMGQCEFCYKGNGQGETHNMSFETFKNIFHKMPSTLTQIAFGIMDISTNPHFFEMMKHAREHGVIPNYTCHGLDVTPDVARATANTCGAVSVSIVDKESSYNAVKMFSDAGMSQVNIHYMLSKETLQGAYKLIDDAVNDFRLSGLNAIVFLQLKKKGRAESNQFHYIQSVADYSSLIDYAKEKQVGIGFDSCSAPTYFKSREHTPEYKNALIFGEPCESGLFSSYINVHGEFFPCSFSEGVEGWTSGLSVLEADSFDDIWCHERLDEWRKHLLSSADSCYHCASQSHCRACPIYSGVTVCKT